MNKSYLTAIKRKKLSAPVQWLFKSGLIKDPVLDYGCGKGDDVKHLRELGFNAHGFDPYWGPHSFLWQKYPTILCTYVFNAIKEEEREKELSFLNWMLEAPWGKKLYITVRRDLKQNYIKTKRGTEQWMVYLDYPIIHETSSYCIYEVTR